MYIEKDLNPCLQLFNVLVWMEWRSSVLQQEPCWVCRLGLSKDTVNHCLVLKDF